MLQHGHISIDIDSLEFSPLQLVMGGAIILPVLIMGIVATKSMSDCEDVMTKLETLEKTFSKFQEADIIKKLKNCQKLSIKAYSHCEP